MVSKDSIKIGDYVRWLYPLGYVDLQRRNFSYGLVMNVREEEDEQSIDGKIVLLLDSGYKQTFWLFNFDQYTLASNYGYTLSHQCVKPRRRARILEI